MRDAFLLLIHLLVTLAKFLLPGGVRAVAAESLVLKHQLLICNRSDIDGVAVCRMFNHAIARQPLPKHISTDHDPLFRFHRWLSNLRVLEIDAVTPATTPAWSARRATH